MNLDLGEVLNRTWQITWKHKVLWVYGFLQIMVSFLLIPLALIPALAPLVSSGSGQFERFVTEPWFFLIFFGIFLVFMLALYPLTVLVNGALSVGVLRAERGDEKLSFMELIRESLPFFWRILGIMLLFTVGMMVVTFAFSALQTALAVVTMGIASICLAPLSLLIYPLMFVGYVWMEQSMAAAVVDNMHVTEAAKQGWQVFRNNLAGVSVIGLVLYFGVSIIAALAIMPMMVPFFALPFAFSVEEFNRAILVGAGVCASLYLPLFAIFQGAMIALMKSGWILTYLRLTRNPKLQPLPVNAEATM
jgi:hypothetical protein